MTAALLLHRAGGALPSTNFRIGAFGTTDPFARVREIAWEGPGSMCAGRVSFSGELDVGHYPHTETIVVVDGELDGDSWKGEARWKFPNRERTRPFTASRGPKGGVR